MRFFPVFLDLDHQPVLVVGGGEQAAQKIRLLAKTKARIRVLARIRAPRSSASRPQGVLALEPRAAGGARPRRRPRWPMWRWTTMPRPLARSAWRGRPACR